MSVDNYQLSLTSQLLGDSYAPLLLVRDSDDVPQSIDIPALVASGDCFITIATALDAIHDNLPREETAARHELSRLTALLLSLQREYQVRPKPADYHQ